MIFTTHKSSSAGNLYTLRADISTLIIEAGVSLPAIKKALDFKLSSIRACLVTHSHMDHCKGARDLMKTGVDCYMTAETAETRGLAGHRLNIIEPLKQFKIEGWTVLPFPTIHDTPGSVGYLIENSGEKCLFLTDTHYCKYRFKGLNIIAIECNWSKQTIAPDLDPVVKRRLYKSHMSLERVEKFMKANDLSTVREIILLHLSEGNSDAELFKSRIQAVSGRPVRVAGK